MVRYVVFLLFSFFLVTTLASRFDIQLDDSSIAVGIIIAALVAVVNLGWEWFFGAIRHPFHPQVVVHPTRQSPWQVLWGSFGSLVKGIVIVLILLIVITTVLYPDIDIPGTIVANFNEIIQAFGVTVE